MNREEQIKQYLKERNIPTDSLEANSIVEGINWADENPKEGLVSIDKVCEWVEKNIWDFPWYDPDKPLSTNDIIKELRKDLEK